MSCCHCWHWDKKPYPAEELLEMLEGEEDYCCHCSFRRKHEGPKHGEFLKRASDWQDGVEWEYDHT